MEVIGDCSYVESSLGLVWGVYGLSYFIRWNFGGGMELDVNWLKSRFCIFGNWLIVWIFF